MRLTGKQAEAIHDISDGADVNVSKDKNAFFITVQRIEDNLRVRVARDGTVFPILTAATEDSN